MSIKYTSKIYLLSEKPIICFYCGGTPTGVEYAVIGCDCSDRTGIRFCGNHHTWAKRDIRAYFHAEDIINLEDISQIEILNNFFSILEDSVIYVPKYFSGGQVSVQKFNFYMNPMKISKEQHIPIMTYECCYMPCYIDDDWQISLFKLEKDNTFSKKDVYLHELENPKVVSKNDARIQILLPFVRDILLAGIYKKEFDEYMSLQ